MGDEEELLQPGRPRLPRRVRLAALLLAVLAAAALIAIRAWPRPTHRSAAGPSATASVPAVVPPLAMHSTSVITPPWPSAPGACDNDVDLSIVSSTSPSEHTGIRVLLGGNQLRTVNFDSGRAKAMPQARLRRGEFVTGLLASAQTYASTGVCMGTGRSRLLRIGTDGSVGTVTLLSSDDGVFADETHVWVVSWPKSRHASGDVRPLAGGRRVWLPAGFDPWAITSGVVVGNLQPRPSQPGPGLLLLVDATTGRVARLGKGWPLAVGAGLVVWTQGCNPLKDTPCSISSTSVKCCATAGYRLPRPAFDGVISPDGRLVALTLERPGRDPRFTGGHPIPPSDIAVLHLDTGRLEIVPGIELPAKYSPSFAFSADDRWLVVALDAGPRTRLLAWRSGLAHPYESKPIAGPTMEPPPILILPARAGGG